MLSRLLQGRLAQDVPVHEQANVRRVADAEPRRAPLELFDLDCWQSNLDVDEASTGRHLNTLATEFGGVVREIPVSPLFFRGKVGRDPSAGE